MLTRAAGNGRLANEPGCDKGAEIRLSLRMCSIAGSKPTGGRLASIQMITKVIQ
jgi:hypothetical protein